MDSKERDVIDKFHELYYNGLAGEDHIYKRTYWLKVPCLKCPLDLWIYQEIISELQPDLIVETGTHFGGSALFMAHVLDIIGKGEIVTIDIQDLPRPAHPRIKYVNGSSSDIDLIHSLLHPYTGKVCLAVLDSDHSKNHVLQELNIISPFISTGSYIIVEDSNINGHPTFQSFGDGLYEAIEEFLKTNPNFVTDSSREKFLMTFNPQGYLKRID